CRVRRHRAGGAPTRRRTGDAGRGRTASFGGDVPSLGRRGVARGAQAAGDGMSDTRALDGESAQRIASAFSPERWHGSRMHYFYARTKLRTDPLYPGVVDALRGTSAPLLALGCGIGLLAHALRASGLNLPYRGIDNDATKIAAARQACANAALVDVDFDCIDLAAGPPAHRGSVAILDVLQFVSPDAQDAILDA